MVYKIQARAVSSEKERSILDGEVGGSSPSLRARSSLQGKENPYPGSSEKECQKNILEVGGLSPSLGTVSNLSKTFHIPSAGSSVKERQLFKLEADGSSPSPRSLFPFSKGGSTYPSSSWVQRQATSWRQRKPLAPVNRARKTDHAKVGSSPASGTTSPLLVWGQCLGQEDCIYMRRWLLNLGFISFRVHHWIASDDPRHFHDHPWWFLTFVIKGAYTDVSPKGDKRMQAGTVGYRPALHRQTVKVDSGGCWTIMVTGKKSRNWGFWIGEKFKKANKYFLEHGEHPCN